MIAELHFLRPWWLIAMIPALLLAWGAHRLADTAAPWRGIVADRLIPYLLRGGDLKRRQGPVVLMLTGWATASVVLAGPAWKRQPAPFADDVAALAIVVKVSPSMETQDLAPSRLTRSVQKIHDLLSHRGRAQTALIAYAGSAHLVMPATTDSGIIDDFAAALAPPVMPVEGDVAADALKLADSTLAKAGGGSILWITDSISPQQRDELARWQKSAHSPLHLLAPLVESPELSALRDAAAYAKAGVIPLTADDTDVIRLGRASKFASPTPEAGGDRWQDAGYFLTPLLALMVLPFFRRGWMPASAAHS